YTTLFIVLGIALAVVIAASYFTHHLALSPISLLLLFLLVGIPLGAFMRFFPMQLMADSMPQEMKAEIVAYRRANNQSPLAIWVALGSLIASHGVLAFIAIVDPVFDSTAFNLLMLAWLGLFIFGYTGLIYTSRWMQTHGLLLAIIGAILVLGGLAALFAMFRAGFQSSDLFAVAAVLSVQGVPMMISPLLISFGRSSGLID
ncbi:MAG TPA: hypothetical protein VG309_09900, partial [Rhizomicrobium sp.]|nr:hypothetical protein [Rhizomicrobium sp.]